MRGPVVIEAVVDPHEPPMPPMIKKEQAKHLAEALLHGTPNARRIGLTIGRDLVDESTFEASPAGVMARLFHKKDEE
jgi:pyruvate dehydrogenase (quinone)/pyruvate oxidase